MTRTAAALAGLQDYESRNITYIDPAGGWPIVWARAQGTHVWDEEGRRYLDLTAAFGVAAAGHANSRVVRAGQKQMATLLHAMGDVHPHALKGQLAQKLSELTYGRWRRAGRGKVIFGNSGFEAVEAALKTARLATGRRGVVAFTGGYHGLGYGTLNTTHRGHFRDPFRDQLREFGHFVPYPPSPAREHTDAVLPQLREALQTGEIGAVLVEPVQARGGIRIPHRGFLTALRRLTDDAGALLILDEIYTGFGRTGRMFAAERSRVVPDLICLGKALTGGFPLSACVGQADLGSGVAGVHRRGDSYWYLPGAPGGLRDGAGADSGNRATGSARAGPGIGADLCPGIAEGTEHPAALPPEFAIERSISGFDDRHRCAPRGWPTRPARGAASRPATSPSGIDRFARGGIG